MKFNIDSFGSDCPSNWKEICDYLNGLNPDDFGCNGTDSGIDVIWDKFCNGELPDCPKPIYS